MITLRSVFRLAVVSLAVFAPTAASLADDERVLGAVEGRVIVAGANNPDPGLPGAEVRLEPLVRKSVLTDAGGTFVLREVPLGDYELVVSSPGFVVERRPIRVEGGVATVEIALVPAQTTLESIDVVGSYSLGRDSPASTAALSAEELLELPHFGDDIFRAVPVLPGVSANDATAEFAVRGGLSREVSYRIDGLEIFEPYHLRDFQGLFSIIDPGVLGGLDLFTGGFPVEYGDKSAGVLDLTTFTPRSRSSELGISLLNAWGSSSGTFDQGNWFASARRGWFDIVLDLIGDEVEETEVRRGSGPQYWDVIGKVDVSLSPSTNLVVQTLLSSDSNDEYERELEDGGFFEEETTDSSYGNDYLWARLPWVVGSSGFVETMVSFGRVDRDRQVAEIGENRDFEISDVRTLDILQARQDASWQLGDRHLLTTGWEARRYEADYDYRNEFAELDQVDSELGVRPITQFEGSFESDHVGVWLSDRWRIGPRFVVEAGARWDQFSLTDEDHVSPRINGLWEIGDGWRGRFAWGHFHQTQRPNELQVEDGETEFFPAERAEHRILGLERSWASSAARWELRLEAYQRATEDPRPRYENIFQNFVLNPETANDRFRIAPESAEARGGEIFLARRGSGTFDWWVNYTFSEAEDRIDGRDVPRATDQTHAFNASLSWRPSPRWSFNAVWVFHSGWPTTPLSAELGLDENGQPIAVPVVGELRSASLDDYHRLDVRASRRFARRSSVVELFIDIQNVYNRRNAAGVEVDGSNFFVDQTTGQAVYLETPEQWLPLVPSFGISWTF